MKLIGCRLSDLKATYSLNDLKVPVVISSGVVNEHCLGVSYKNEATFQCFQVVIGCLTKFKPCYKL